MAPLPRRLHVAVGTSLLGASLALACTGKDVHVNPGPDEKPAEKKAAPELQHTVNEGPNPPPQPEPPQPEPPPPPPERSPQDIHVNEGPVPPEPPPQPDLKVNPGPSEPTPAKLGEG